MMTVKFVVQVLIARKLVPSSCTPKILADKN
jgi:hypothetical protein